MTRDDRAPKPKKEATAQAVAGGESVTFAYLMTVCVRRWAWWPAHWPLGKRSLMFVKRTTLPDVLAMRDDMLAGGAFSAEFDVVRGSMRGEA